MAEQKLDAIFMEGTTSCFYFADMRWGQSERTFGVVIPAKGELAYVCPEFEEDRARELIKFGNDVRTWQEDESPYALIAGHREGPRRAASPHRHRRARALLHRRRRAQGRAGLRDRGRHAGHRRLPHDQVDGRDRADAARDQRDDCRLPGGVHDDARRHDAGRAGGEHRGGVRRARLQRRRQRAVRQVDRAAARQHHAAETQGRRHRHDRRRRELRGLRVGHHAHDRVRQADGSGRTTCGTWRRARRRPRSRP